MMGEKATKDAMFAEEEGRKREEAENERNREYAHAKEMAAEAAGMTEDYKKQIQFWQSIANDESVET